MGERGGGGRPAGAHRSSPGRSRWARAQAGRGAARPPGVGGGRQAGDHSDRQRLMETLARPCPAPHSRGRPAHLRFPPCPQVSDKFAFGLFDLDWDVFTQHIEGAINRVPVLEKTGIKSTVCGPGEWGGPELAAVGAGCPQRRGRWHSVLGGRCCTSSSLQVADASSWGAVVCPGPPARPPPVHLV